MDIQLEADMQLKYIIIALFAVALISAAGAWVYPSYQKYKQAEKDHNKVQQELIGAKSENEALEKKCHALKTDDKEIERVARDTFSMCKEGEKIYDFVE